MYLVEKLNNNEWFYYNSDNDNGAEIPVIKNEIVLTSDNDIKNYYKQQGLTVYDLSEYLGLPKNLSLYEVFSHLFEGKILSDIDMLEVIYKGILDSSDWCFCLKIGVTFCWFTVGKDRLKKLGTMQFGEKISNYTVGRFFKRLRYNIAKTGINLNKVKFLYWNEDDYNLEFSKYILTFDYLSDFFSKIDGLNNLKANNIIKLLSKTIQDKYVVNAENFVDSLADSFLDLGLYQKDGILYSTNIYYKDYNTCVCSIIDSTKCSYGIIIDTEGVKGLDGAITNGVSELGGLIYCKYGDILLNIDTFECDTILLEETLNRVILNYRELSHTSKIKKIPTLIYGKADKLMLEASVKNKRLLDTLTFIDCKVFIKSFSTISLDKPTLSNIAKTFGVKPVYPKHKSLNDAKTLFNILAKILQDSGEFVI